MIARARLRTILAGYVGIQPGEIAFRYGASGKPSLEFDGSSRPLDFNLSHSYDFALVAVAARSIGVDLERIRLDLVSESLARMVMTARELRLWLRLTEAARAQAFFTCWVSKEAVLKERGDGLGMDPRRVEIGFGDGSTDPHEVTGLPLKVIDPDDPATLWQVHPIQPHPGYVAAIAMKEDSGAPRITWFDARACDPPSLEQLGQTPNDKLLGVRPRDSSLLTCPTPVQLRARASDSGSQS